MIAKKNSCMSGPTDTIAKIITKDGTVEELAKYMTSRIVMALSLLIMKETLLYSLLLKEALPSEAFILINDIGLPVSSLYLLFSFLAAWA